MAFSKGQHNNTWQVTHSAHSICPFAPAASISIYLMSESHVLWFYVLNFPHLIVFGPFSPAQFLILFFYYVV